ncbi:MAG TPA: hypothetical protein VGM30_24930 [Puia sp.]|jgi:hypothetical protein
MKKLKKGEQPMAWKPRPIEPKIKPLVDALMQTKLLKTFSSCQGHYRGTDQLQQDRNFADVRFWKLPKASEKELQAILVYVVSEFWPQKTDMTMEAFKKYIPSAAVNDDPIYLITLTPLDRFDHPHKKRKDTDNGIKLATELVKIATRLNKEGKLVVK